MKGIKFKPVQTGRKMAILGASVAVAGLSLLGGAVAHAAGIGNNPGQLSFSPASGSLSNIATWSTGTACPAGYNFATLELVAADSTPVNPDIIVIGAQTVNGTAPVSNQQLLASITIGNLESLGGYSAGYSAEAVVLCSAGAGGTGTTTYDQSQFINFQADGSTYTTSPTPQFVTPTVTLSVQPNPVQANSQVTLTATVMSGNIPVTTGAVQFENDFAGQPSLIGSPVTVSSSGVATTTTTFTSANPELPLLAVYQAASASQFSNSPSNLVTEDVTIANPNSGPELITVTTSPSGTFTFSSPANATVPLTVSGATAAGALVPVTVTDTRTGLAPDPAVPSLVIGYSGYPGWSVVGQATDFTNPTSTPAGNIPASNLTWTPTTTTPGDFTLGNATTAGLGSAQVLAKAAAGHGDGTFSLGASLSLAIPAAAPAGAYASTLTITANLTANFS